MSGYVLLVRVENRTASLERILGRLRSRIGGTPRISLGREDDGSLQLLVTIDRDVGSREQLRAELLQLRDVRSVQELAGEAGASRRELALVRLLRRPGDEGPSRGRVVSESDEVRLVELTGTAAEVDRILESWRKAGLLAGAARTGEVLPPADTGPAPPT